MDWEAAQLCVFPNHEPDALKVFLRGREDVSHPIPSENKFQTPGNCPKGVPKKKRDQRRREKRRGRIRERESSSYPTGI